MVTKHEVYPGDMSRAIENEADRLGTSVSGLYKEAIRNMAQNPNSRLDAEAFDSLNEVDPNGK